MIPNKTLTAIFSLLLATLIVVSITGSYSFAFGLGIGDSWQWLVSLGVVCSLLGGYLYKQRAFEEIGPVVFGSIAALYLAYGSDYPRRNFVYPLVDQPLLMLPLIGAALLLLEKFFCSSWSKKNLFTFSLISPRLLLVFQLLIFFSFLSYADGRLIFSDDHPSFLYRLQMLLVNFPDIPFYNTDWNGGYSAREFYATGALSLFFVSLPFLLLSNIFSVEGAAIYTTIVATIFIIVQPWCVYLAARLTKVGRMGSALAAIVVFAPSLSFFEWLLKYGTIPFLFSTALFPLVFALCWRILFSEESPRWREVALLIVTSSLCVLWSGSFFMLLPLAVLGLCRPQVIFSKQRRVYTLTFAIFFVAGLFLWLPNFIHHSGVLNFVSSSALPGVAAEKASFWPSLEKLIMYREKGIAGAVKVHPLLFVLIVPGLICISAIRLRVVIGVTLLWLLFLSYFGNAFKPQLELHRMILPACFLLALLSGAALEKGWQALLGDYRRSVRDVFISAFCFVLLSYGVGSVMIAPYVAHAAYNNQTIEKYKFAPVELETLSAAIRDYGGDGRTFFSGFILHELGTSNSTAQDGGHIAPLPTFSGKELYAFDFYHRRWATLDPIPKSFRSRGHQGIEEFLDTIYATAVVTYKPEWRDYCQKYPQIYQEVYQSDRFRLFKRNTKTNSFVIKGKGEVKRIVGGLEFTPDPSVGEQEVILRYRFLPHLKASPADYVTIEPHFAFDDHKTETELEPYDFIKLQIKNGLKGSIKITY